MAEDKSSNINIKASSVIVGISLLLISVLGWSLSTQYSSITTQISKQWQKLDRMEKVICSNHPANCPQL